MSKKLTIVNSSKLVHTIINDFELFDIHEKDDKYIFEFRIIPGKGFHKVIEIPLTRFGHFDNAYNCWMYRVNNESRYVSANWFSDIDNVLKTFEEIIRLR